MLNIENYDQWTKVCDDDDLIMELYDSGIRPGTEEFKDLLGEPSKGNPASSKDQMFLAIAFGLVTIFIWGFVKLVKLICKKVKQFINKKIRKQEKTLSK